MTEYPQSEPLEIYPEPEPPGPGGASGLHPEPTLGEPVGDTLLEVLEAAAAQRASDVLLTVGAPILWRLDGKLLPAGSAPLDLKQAQLELYGILEQDQIARFERDRELDFSIRIEGAGRFRGNAYWQRGGVAAVFRLVPGSVPSIGELGLPEIVSQLTRLEQGLVLVTGPTGHGKSTTLASMVDLINQERRCHIITIEDPIEYEHPHGLAVIDQREVGSDTHSFDEALRRVMRQSPEVIMVGEMRDRETIAAALTAAETGHLVLATLHTNDAAQSIDRCVDVFPPEQQSQIRGQLSQVLSAVVSQRLLPRLSGTGRSLACEILIVTPAVRHQIRDDKVHGIITVIETGGQHGMQTIDQSLRSLVQEGLVGREDAIPFARDPDRIR